MSADNGIYVLETLAADGGKEYRVANLAAIDNLTFDEAAPMSSNSRYNSKDPEVLVKNARKMFGMNCKVFTNRDEADLYAAKRNRSEYTEYGICNISIPRIF